MNTKQAIDLARDYETRANKALSDNLGMKITPAMGVSVRFIPTSGASGLFEVDAGGELTHCTATDLSGVIDHWVHELTSGIEIIDRRGIEALIDLVRPPN